jgi:hypothetical protein
VLISNEHIKGLPIFLLLFVGVKSAGLTLHESVGFELGIMLGLQFSDNQKPFPYPWITCLESAG